MPGLIGKKIGMTSVFGADGKNIPCTVIEAGPCVVTQIRTVEKSVENLLKSKELLLPLQSAKTMRILIIYCNTNS